MLRPAMSAAAVPPQARGGLAGVSKLCHSVHHQRRVLGAGCSSPFACARPCQRAARLTTTCFRTDGGQDDAGGFSLGPGSTLTMPQHYSLPQYVERLEKLLYTSDGGGGAGGRGGNGDDDRGGRGPGDGDGDGESEEERWRRMHTWMHRSFSGEVMIYCMGVLCLYAAAAAVALHTWSKHLKCARVRDSAEQSKQGAVPGPYTDTKTSTWRLQLPHAPSMSLPRLPF
mmetsp:Transcript_47170/g.87973  ORF Transcript_47170/g.87973 Transcript_47170/m.87973 type:complete len:227 (-) Transcript_47170:340-1020(-)